MSLLSAHGDVSFDKMVARYPCPTVPGDAWADGTSPSCAETSGRNSGWELQVPHRPAEPVQSRRRGQGGNTRPAGVLQPAGGVLIVYRRGDRMLPNRAPCHGSFAPAPRGVSRSPMWSRAVRAGHKRDWRSFPGRPFLRQIPPQRCVEDIGPTDAWLCRPAATELPNCSPASAGRR